MYNFSTRIFHVGTFPGSDDYIFVKEGHFFHIQGRVFVKQTIYDIFMVMKMDKRKVNIFVISHL